MLAISETCSVTDDFALISQAALGMVAFSTLVCKYYV